MFAIRRLAILGALFLMPMIGCRSSDHHAASYPAQASSMPDYASVELPPPGYDPGTADEWTCPMHPRFKSPEPGKCSICGMDLVRQGDSSPAERRSSESGHSHSSGSGDSHSSGGGCCG